MPGIMLASLLIIRCTVINFDPQPTLVCRDRTNEKVISIPYSQWPQEWHGPELGFTYKVRVVSLGDGLFTGVFLRSRPDLTAAERNRLRSRFHQQRWHRQPLQNPQVEGRRR